MLIPMSLAGVATWLVVPGSPSSRIRRLDTVPLTVRARSWRIAPALAAGIGAGVVTLLLLGLGSLGWAIAAAIAVGTCTWLILDHLSAFRARKRADEVAGAARLLASLLRSGQIPMEALREAAIDFPVLREAASTSQVGGDVATALEAGSLRRGAEGLATIAAAWRVSERSGAPVAGVLQRVSDSLRQERRVREIVETELAAARASGRIMAVLPFGAVGLGFFAGVNPLEFLFGAWLGQWLSCVAVALTAIGVVWIERLAKR